jgi:methionyl-tRNA formyltransferase
MRTFLFANNLVGWQVSRWLRTRETDICGVAIHPEGSRRFADEILRSAGVADDAVFDGSRIHEPEVLGAIARLAPEIGVSVMFGYILQRGLLDLFPAGCVNLHPALLPHNRGSYPNVWSIVDGTPSGVTLHYIDEGVDTGDVIAQSEVAVESTDTGETLYRRLEQASIALFQSTWPTIESGTAARSRQSAVASTAHRVADVSEIDRIELDRDYRAGDLLNILRARTFDGYRGAYFLDGDEKVYIRVSLEREHDSE